jgi:hypothetical protein
MKRVTTLVLTVALGTVWAAAVIPVAAEDAADKATEIKDRASDTARDAKEKLESASERAKDKASDTARDATESLKSTGKKVKQKAIDVKNKGKAKLRRAVRDDAPSASPRTDERKLTP